PAARVVLLDHEGAATWPGRGRSGGYGLARAVGVALGPVRREPVGSGWCKGSERVAALGEEREDVLRLELGQVRREDLVPRARRGDPRPLPTAQRVRRHGGLRRGVLGPVHEDLPLAERLALLGDDEVRVVLLERARELL